MLHVFARNLVLVSALLCTLHALGGPKEILEGVKPGEWVELPNTNLSKVFPPRDGHPGWGIVGPRAVVGAWSGAAFDTKRNVLVVIGGGHGDYGGNEVYEFDLNTLKWVRATEPSPLRLTEGPVKGIFEAVGSEAPVSTHTYDGLQYMPNVDRVFKYGGSCYLQGAACDPHAYFYDVERNSWQRKAAARMTLLEVASDYDPRTGLIYISNTAGLMTYDPRGDSWRILSMQDSSRPPGIAAIDPERRMLVQTFSTQTQLAYYLLDKPAPRQIAPASGAMDWIPHSGLAYHPPSKHMVLWSGGADVWIFNTRDWVISKITPRKQPSPTASDKDGREKTRGIYGRWQWVPDYDLFIAYNYAYDNVWLYRLPH